MSRAEVALTRIGDALAAIVTRSAWMRRWYVPATAAALTAFAIVAVFRMETTVPNYDPQYMRVLVERTMEQGGSYYSNGIHNKGPLEPVLYEIAGTVGGRDGWWFVVAVFALVAAVCVGLGAAVVAVRVGGSTLLGVCVAVAAIVHLTVSDADYAGVLYARNITTALMALVLGVAAYGPFWASDHRRRRAVVAIGTATGLAVQTLLTAAFTVLPLLLWAMWERRSARVWGRPAWLVVPAVSAIAFASAPLLYLTIGPRQDFVDGYWTHARFMSTGTGRTLASQLELGWDQFVDYYGARPELVTLLVASFLVAGARWRALSPSARGLHVAVAAWWVGAWVELVASQRYSSHYFSVLAVPTIMLLALLVGDVAPLLRPMMRSRPAFALLPLLVAYVTIEVGGRTGFDLGVESVATVRSTGDFAARREVGVDGRTRMLRATLDLVSDEGDPLLVWTSYPWPYLNLERTSATRYIWKTFLLGEIYLGERGPEYVLPGTWEQFEADLDDTDPAAYYVEAVNPIDPTTPFDAAVDARFTDVFADDGATLGLRRDLATWLAEPVPAADATPVPELSGTPYTASPDGCVRIDGAIAPEATEPLVVELGGEQAAALVASVAGDTVVVQSRPVAGAGWMHRVPIGDDPLPIRVVVGARAAVLVVDGRVAGAVEVAAGTAVVVSSGVTELTELGATVSTPPPVTGC